MQDDTNKGNNGGKTPEPQPLFTDEEIAGFMAEDDREEAEMEAKLREQFRRQIVLRERADRYTYLMETLTTEYGEMTAKDAEGVEIGMIYNVEKLMGYVARRRHETYLESSVEELLSARRRDMDRGVYDRMVFGTSYEEQVDGKTVSNPYPPDLQPVPGGPVFMRLRDERDELLDERVRALDLLKPLVSVEEWNEVMIKCQNLTPEQEQNIRGYISKPVPEGTVDAMLEDASNAGYLPVTDEQVAATVDNIKAHLLTQLQGKTTEELLRERRQLAADLLPDALARGEVEGRALTKQTSGVKTNPEYERTHCANCQARLLDEQEYCPQCGVVRDGSGRRVEGVLSEMGGGYKAQEVPTARVTEDLTPADPDETYDYSHIGDPSA